MFFKKKKEKTPKTSNMKVVPNMKPIEELRTNKDVAEWCRDFLRITDELSPELAIADRTERNYLMALVGLLVEWFPRKDLSLKSLAVLLSLADARENDEDFALLCWNSVNHLPAIRRISLKASLTSRLIDFKYLREAEPAAEVPAGTRWVPSDATDYGFDDDDDDISAFSFPEA